MAQYFYIRIPRLLNEDMCDYNMTMFHGYVSGEKADNMKWALTKKRILFCGLRSLVVTGKPKVVR